MKKIAPCLAAVLCLLALWSAPERVHADIPKLPGTRITIPWEQFQEMLRPLREQPGDAAKPAGPAVSVESADYEFFAGREQVKITASFNITVTTGAWQFTPLVDSSLTLASFASGDAEDTVRLEDDAYQLFTKTPGARTVQLVLYAPGDFNRMENSYALHFLEQANTRHVTVIVPEANADITRTARRSIFCAHYPCTDKVAKTLPWKLRSAPCSSTRTTACSAMRATSLPALSRARGSRTPWCCATTA